MKSKVKITITLGAKIVCAKLSENSIQYLNKFLRGENNLKHLLTKLERIKGFFFRETSTNKYHVNFNIIKKLKFC